MEMSWFNNQQVLFAVETRIFSASITSYPGTVGDAKGPLSKAAELSKSWIHEIYWTVTRYPMVIVCYLRNPTPSLLPMVSFYFFFLSAAASSSLAPKKDEVLPKWYLLQNKLGLSGFILGCGMRQPSCRLGRFTSFTKMDLQTVMSWAWNQGCPKNKTNCFMIAPHQYGNLMQCQYILVWTLIKFSPYLLCRSDGFFGHARGCLWCCGKMEGGIGMRWVKN